MSMDLNFSATLNILERNKGYLNSAMNTIREYISGWSTQKLCEVLAFCEDGKMDYWKSCCCLLGVSTSDILHTVRDGNCDGSHYENLIESIHGRDCEMAYFNLGTPINLQQRLDDSMDTAKDNSQLRRDERLVNLIREELSRRELDLPKNTRYEYNECYTYCGGTT